MIALRLQVIFMALSLIGSTLAEGQDLVFVLKPGLDQQRNYERSGFWTTQLVRSLPPTNASYVFTVQGSQEWLDLDQSGGATTHEAELLNEGHIRPLRAAMAQQGIFSVNDPVLLAGRAIALLRPMELDGQRAPARYARVVPIWKLLASSTEADTFSVAVAIAQFLEDVGVRARVAKYPTASGVLAYGVAVWPRHRKALWQGESWVLPVGDYYLLPAALSASPASSLAPEEIETWTAAEIFSPESKLPGETPENPAPASILFSPPLPPEENTAVLLGRLQRARFLILLSAVGLGSWLIFRLGQHRRRKQRVARRRENQMGNQF